MFNYNRPKIISQIIINTSMAGEISPAILQDLLIRLAVLNDTEIIRELVISHINKEFWFKKLWELEKRLI